MTDFGTVKQPQRDKIFDALSNLEWHRWDSLKNLTAAYNRRIYELRRLGYVVDTQNLTDGSKGCEYRLRSLTPGEPQSKRVRASIDPEDARSFLKTGKFSGEFFDAIMNAVMSYEINEANL
jgi:hypothetical protein